MHLLHDCERGDSGTVVYEDEHFLAFDDTRAGTDPYAHHPKHHFNDMGTTFPPRCLSPLRSVPLLRRQRGVDVLYRVIVNNGRDAAQSVGHLHVH